MILEITVAHRQVCGCRNDRLYKTMSAGMCGGCDQPFTGRAVHVLLPAKADPRGARDRRRKAWILGTYE